MMSESSYPLAWPTGRPRTTNRQDAKFGVRSIDTATRELARELSRMGIPDYRFILSSNLILRMDGYPRSNQPNPIDPGVAVYFTLKGRKIVMACDKWRKVEDNLWAIVKNIEATRGITRWGAGELEQAFAGYAALPGPAPKRNWKEVFGIQANALDANNPFGLSAVLEIYRTMAKTCHPDMPSGSHAKMAELNDAMEEARLYYGK